ncbi:MAG: hypothetical protein M3011_03740 [Actinomycetota bacterium]|nr:hypothetical protein [Actinomycetota bacterium]
MFNAVIEIAIGLIVLYSLLSLVCSKTNELVATFLHLRARNLRKAIRHLVGGTYATKVYEHPFVVSLYRGDAKPATGIKKACQWLFLAPGPSYLPADKFVIALLDNTCKTAVTADPPLPPDPSDRLQYALSAQPSDDDSVGSGSEPGPEAPSPTPADVKAQITAQLDEVTDPELKKALKTLWRAASENVVTFRAGVEEWFNHTMDRATGWYKRTAQIMALGLGLTLAVAMNVDTVHVTERLWSDGPLRSAVLEQVKKLPLPPTTTTMVSPTTTTTTVGGAPAPAVPASTTPATTTPATTAPATATPATAAPPAGAPPTAVVGGIGDQVESIQSGLGQVSGLQLPLGWGKGQRPDSYPIALLGWLLTAIALSLGAPFWFDLLNKVTALRGGGTQETTPTQSPKKATTPR